MKKLVITLLVIFLLVDVFLAVTLLFPKLSSTILQKTFFKQITVTSEIPDIKVNLVNEKYLNEKLKLIDFWGIDKVTLTNIKKKKRTSVTVERLKFILTDKRQDTWMRSDSKSENDSLYSYGQLYDPSTKTMTLLLHFERSHNSGKPLRERYTGLAIFTLFNITYPLTAAQGSTFDKQLASFMPEQIKTPEKYYIFNIK